MNHESAKSMTGIITTHYSLITRACAILVLLLGMTTLAGWAMDIPLLVLIRADWAPMVVNTAIGFILGGMGLFAATLRRPWSTPIATVLGMLIILIGLHGLIVLVFNIDSVLSLPDLHRRLQPGDLHPGSMAPSTATCLILFGIALCMSVRLPSGASNKWVKRAAAGLLAIGLLGVISYPLHLEYLYSWGGTLRMAIHTGFGMVLLSIGVFNLAKTHAVAPIVTDNAEIAAVYRAAWLLLLLIAVSAGISSFSFLQVQVEHQVREHLMQMATDRILFLGQTIDNRSLRAEVASDDFALLLRPLATSSDNSSSLALARKRADGLRTKGFSYIGANLNGKHWPLSGAPTPPALSIALQGSRPGWLLWQNGFVLKRSLPVSDDAGNIGTLVTEQPLDSVSALVTATNQIGETGEMAVCGGDKTMLHCFPVRSRAQPFNTPRIVAGKSLPMDFALRGKSGTVMTYDYRRHRVLAAHGPIADTGLGLVVKRDINEIYAPIRQQFQLTVIFLAALLVLGSWVMRRQLKPLLRALSNSRARARADSARFQAAVESNLDAFFIFETMRTAAGDVHDFRYVLLNERGEHINGKPRAEIIGRGMCELEPELRSNGMLAKCIQVLETGEPLVEVRSANILQGHWFQMQLVKLGDGLAMTMRDITAERNTTEQILHLAMHDPLTGLANRAGFETAFTGAIAEAKQRGHAVALALLDLDGFKNINDTLGHAAGDLVLQEVALRLRACTRPTDTLARLGGDEFVLVLPHIHYPEGAEVVARKLVLEIARPMQIADREVVVSVSIGISVCPQHSLKVEDLLEHADTAMYQAKRAGRNGYRLYDASAEALLDDGTY